MHKTKIFESPFYARLQCRSLKYNMPSIILLLCSLKLCFWEITYEWLLIINFEYVILCSSLEDSLSPVCHIDLYYVIVIFWSRYLFSRVTTCIYYFILYLEGSQESECLIRIPPYVCLGLNSSIGMWIIVLMESHIHI